MERFTFGGWEKAVRSQNEGQKEPQSGLLPDKVLTDEEEEEIKKKIKEEIRSNEETKRKAQQFFKYYYSPKEKEPALDQGAAFEEWRVKQEWGKDGEICNDVFYCFSRLREEPEMFREEMFKRERKRREVYAEIERKRWDQSKNLGKKKEPPRYLTLCNIGPNDCFLELTPEVIRIIDRDLDEEDIKGLSKEEIEAIENRNAIDYRTGICDLIDPDKRKEILTNFELYNALLIRGLFLYTFLFNLGEEISIIITKSFEKISKKFKKFAKDKGGTFLRPIVDEKTGKKTMIPRSFFEEKMGIGWEALRETAKKLEKDFFGTRGGIRENPFYYLAKVSQYDVSKDLPSKEEVSMALTSPFKRDGSGSDTVFDVLVKNGVIRPELYRTDKRQIEEFTESDLKVLTERQKKIFNDLLNKKKKKNIAADLGVQPKTIQREFKKIVGLLKPIIRRKMLD